MTVECRAVFESGKIRNLEPLKLGDLRKRHKDGDELTIIFDDRVETDAQKKSRLFHSLRDAYAHFNGYDLTWAKTELKYLHGRWKSYDKDFQPPRWRAGQFVELPEGYPERLIYMKSTTCYSAAEWDHLIDHTIHDCVTIGAPIEEILQGVKG